MTVATLPQTRYADLDDLIAHVRKETLLQCLDWDNDGVIDAGPLEEVMRPACTDIDMALQTSAGIYGSPFVAPFPPALKDLALDGMTWRLGAKYPRFYVIDHDTLRKHVETRLDKLRRGQLNLGQIPPEPSAIQGGNIFPNHHLQRRRGAVFLNDGTGRWGGVF